MEKTMENHNTTNEEIEIDLREIFSLLWQKAGIILLSGIILGLLSIVGTMLLITPKYTSETGMYVLSKQESNSLSNQDLQTSTLLTKDYAELIKSRTVLEGVIAQLNLDMDSEELLNKMTVETPTDTRIITISVEDEDPYTACEIANAIRDMAAGHIQKVMDIEAVNVVDEANIPDTKSSPSISKNGIIGGALGIFLAIAVILVVYIMNDTIKTPEDVEKYLGLSILGTIPLMETEKKSKKQKSKGRK